MKFKLIAGVLLSILFLLVLKYTNVSSSSMQMERFALPESALKLGDNLYYLGRAKDVDGRGVEGYAFVRRRDGEVKLAKPPRGGPSCYGFLASGAKWKTLESWVVNPLNTSGLDSNFVNDNLSLDISKWESAAGKNILGDGSSTNNSLVADTVSPDGVNEVYFADVTDGNAIAVTIVWGYFGGPPQLRELVEWDQVYDDVDYPWSAVGEAGKMDFGNIATHEIGHSFGMDDIYDSSCLDVTMYGYANYGETKKRDLAQPDITGIQKLYN